MAVQPVTLQSIFAEVATIQHQLHALTLIEEQLNDISDFLDDQQFGANQVIDDIRPLLIRLRRQLKFLAAMQLLQAARVLQQYVQRNHRLPILDLHF